MTYSFKDAKPVFLYLLIGHKSCNMLSMLNKLTLQKELQIPSNVFMTKNKNTKTTKQKSKHNKPCRNRELNTGPLEPKRMRYQCSTESTESNVCSQAI